MSWELLRSRSILCLNSFEFEAQDGFTERRGVLMKAMRFHEYGDPSVLRYEDVEQPVPGVGQVLLRVAATSFNGVDGNIRGGFMRGPIPARLPYTPGIDVS